MKLAGQQNREVRNFNNSWSWINRMKHLNEINTTSASITARSKGGEMLTTFDIHWTSLQPKSGDPMGSCIILSNAETPLQKSSFDFLPLISIGWKVKDQHAPHGKLKAEGLKSSVADIRNYPHPNTRDIYQCHLLAMINTARWLQMTPPRPPISLKML